LHLSAAKIVVPLPTRARMLRAKPAMAPRSISKQLGRACSSKAMGDAQFVIAQLSARPAPMANLHVSRDLGDGRINLAGLAARPIV
jgi:hypothetical protein